MIKHERFINLQWVIHRSMYALANKNVLNSGTEPRKIGSSLSAVNSIVAKGEEMRVLMPSILGTDPLSSKLDWEASVKNYWHGLSVDIPMGGRLLDIGWNIDIHDPSKKDAIAELKESNKSIKTDKDLLNHLFAINGTTKQPNVSEEYLFRYATPANIEDYLLWRYCLVYRRVLNPDADPEILDRNPDIDFFLYDPAITKRKSETILKESNAAMAAYLDLLTKADVKEDVLYVFGENPIGWDTFDKDSKLDMLQKTQPKRFVEITNDKNLTSKSRIERFINAGILNRLAGTGIVIDATDPSVILGNNINEVVAYFNNEANSKAIIEYTTRYKAATVQVETTEN